MLDKLEKALPLNMSGGEQELGRIEGETVDVVEKDELDDPIIKGDSLWCE